MQKVKFNYIYVNAFMNTVIFFLSLSLSLFSLAYFPSSSFTSCQSLFWSASLPFPSTQQQGNKQQDVSTRVLFVWAPPVVSCWAHRALRSTRTARYFCTRVKYTSPPSEIQPSFLRRLFHSSGSFKMCPCSDRWILSYTFQFLDSLQNGRSLSNVNNNNNPKKTTTTRAITKTAGHTPRQIPNQFLPAEHFAIVGCCNSHNQNYCNRLKYKIHHHHVIVVQFIKRKCHGLD